MFPAYGMRRWQSRFNDMKSSTKDRAKGKLKQAAGAAQEKAGRATGNRRMEDRGTDKKVGGKVREKIGDVKKVFER